MVVVLVNLAATSGKAALMAAVSILVEVTCFHVILYSPESPINTFIASLMVSASASASAIRAGGLYRGFHLAGLILYPVPVLCSGLDPIVHFRLSRLGCPPLLRSYYTICSHINLLTEQLNMFPYICCIFIWTHIDRYAIIEAQ